MRGESIFMNNRFTLYKDMIKDNQEPVSYIDVKNGIIPTLNLLNRLNNENIKLKEDERKLFEYFSEWFEEERGVYREDFIVLWENIKKEEEDIDEEEY